MGRKYEEAPVHDDCDDLYDLGNAPDLEKYDYRRRSFSPTFERDCEIPYSTSSRETSGSYQPMLRNPTHIRKDSFSRYRIRNRRARWLCLVLFTAMVIFILNLVRMSRDSARQLEAGPADKQAPKKPPPWESFKFLKRYHGGIRKLTAKERNAPEYPSDQQEELQPSSNASIASRSRNNIPKSIAFDPYPDYASNAYTSKHFEKYECFLDEKGVVRIPKVHYYPGVTEGFPDHAMGSYDVFGLRNDICFERYGRLGPYGYGYRVWKGGIGAGLHGEREGAEDMWTGPDKIPEVNYHLVEWAKMQEVCSDKNRMRFESPGGNRDHLFQKLQISGKRDLTEDPKASVDSETAPSSSNSKNATKAQKPSNEKNLIKLPRTAVLVRTWWNYEYTPEDIIYMRALISELSLLSGGEYTIHFLVHVKDDNLPIWADQKIYDRVLENSLPQEFKGMGTLWSERQMALIYGGLHESFFRDLPVHGVYRGTFLPVQYFAHRNPDFDYFWNWEMDVRYTGQWYHLLNKVQTWAKAQPRKGLWERNGRFYIPSVHGSWEDFKQMVRVQTEMGTDNIANMWSSLSKTTPDGPATPQPKADTPVWGPLGPDDMLANQNDTIPESTHEKDQYTWGVGEEADLIVFNPLFDPDGTTWFFTSDVTGYNTTGDLPPRRAAITTTSRLSRKLLRTMHREVVLARHLMFSEMWPASIALHHGYKAVYAPHPVYVDRNWPTSYLNAVMNAGRNGATGGARTSVFGSREHNFKGTTWFYDAGFAPNLWKRWLGYKVDNDGGEQAELAGEGRMCLPPVLLHPVKGVGMAAEGGRKVEEESDQGEQGRDGVKEQEERQEESVEPGIMD